MRCPSCHNETSEQAKFCTSCGKQIPRCPTCGKVLTKRSRFCTADGTPIPAEILDLLPEESAAVPAPQPEVPAAPQSTCARCGKPVAEGRKLCDDCRAALLAARNTGRAAANTSPCVRCGKPVPEGQQYCDECRSAVEAMQGGPAVVVPPAKTSRFCTRCGQPTEEGQPICAACRAKAAAAHREPETKKKKSGGKIAVLIILIALIAALVGVLIYAIAAGDLLNPPSQSQRDDREDDDDSADGEEESTGEASTDTTDTTEGTESTEAPTVPCTGLATQSGLTEFELGEINQVFALNITATPADTTDEISYTSSDTAVVTVDENGSVTAVGEGTAVVTAACGDQKLQITITCDFGEDDPLVYFVENCDTIYFTTADLETFDQESLRIARNAIFAKSGRKFNDKELQAYYEQFDWYVPTYEPESFDTGLLNEIQMSNLTLVTDYESARGYR